MLHYILQTIAFQLLFLIIYDVFLKKETFFNWNRFYLLVTAIASLILPFVKFDSIRTIVPNNFVIHLPEVILGAAQPLEIVAPLDTASHVISTTQFIWTWDYLFYAGMILAGLIFLYKIIKISTLIQKNPKRWNDKFVLVNLLKSNAAFSFFNYIFLGEWIKEGEKETILKHELVHVSQKHSLDLLLFELLRILFWFNPLVYMYQTRITILHEYIADAKSMKQGDKKQYYEKLLCQIFDTENISFTNTFFNQSLIKKRIIMLGKSKSNRIHLLKYALLIPMVFGMLMYTSSYAQTKSIEKTAALQELTFDELADKYYKEIKKMAQNGAGMHGIQPKYDLLNDATTKLKYIKSMEEVAKIKAYDRFSAEEFIRSEKEQGTYTKATMEKASKVLEKYKSYEDYVAYQKTDQAISDWESDISDGELRLVVEDMQNLTAQEEDKKAKKMALIDSDDYFSKLRMTDKNSTIILDFGKVVNIVEQTEMSGSDDIEVPFSVIDEVPTLDACKNLSTNNEKRQCLSDYISDVINKNFNVAIGTQNELSGKQRISVMFKIGADGNIKDIMVRAPHPALEAEARRVISLLPQMTPGKHKGKNVTVPYNLPILFNIQELPTAVSDLKNPEPQEVTEIPFSVVEEAPIFAGCESISNKDSRKKCTQDKFSSFVNKNFNTKIIDMPGKERIIALFQIDTDGTIKDIKARASTPVLEIETKRVINLMPKMIPGKQRGKVVKVSYSLPIVLQIQ